MAKLSPVLFLLLLLSCTKPQGGSLPQFQVIQELTSADGSAVGTLLGARVSDGLYSAFLIVHGRDTLYRIDEAGYHNVRGLQGPASAADYDGYRIHLLGPAAFETWLSKEGGPSSDGAVVQWSDSLKRFTLELAGEPQDGALEEQ